MLFFIHIPKTAGTTFYDVVKKNYNSFLKPKIENNANEFLRDKLNSKNSNFAIRLPGGYDSAPKTLRLIKNLSENEINKISFIGGHVGYGFHKEIINKEVKYISFIREPKKRIISDYYEHKKEGRHFNDLLNKSNGSFNEYLQYVLDSKLDNILTRQLAGPFDFYLKERSNLNKTILERALINAENITFFNLNNFDEALYFLKEKFRWRNLSYELKNVSSNKKENLTYDEELLSQVVKFDVEIYEYLNNKVVNSKKLNFIQKIRMKF